jgi:hypothetical protein
MGTYFADNQPPFRFTQRPQRMRKDRKTFQQDSISNPLMV